MHKAKVFFTILILYECVAITILQIHRYCVGVFNLNFCEYGAYKYFLICVAFPVLLSVLMWWMPDIVRLFCKKQCMVEKEKTETIHDVLSQIISSKDIERFITAAIIMGIQKFSKTHPKTQAVFDNIMEMAKKSKK